MDDGGRAFPGEQGRIFDEWNQTWSPGMSFLAWFAGQALMGLMSPSLDHCSYKEIAEMAYDQAEAMIAEKRKREKADE